MRSLPASRVAPEEPGGDKAGAAYWDHLWEQSGLPPPIDPLRPGLENYRFRELHAFFSRTFGAVKPGGKLIEIGCAQSVLLPYFARQFGFEVTGVDRSAIGCDRARRILEREHVSGEIHCADLFSPPARLYAQFDWLFSAGVAEHFEDTAAAIQTMGLFLKPGGHMITLIPNLSGLAGSLQKRLDRAIYDIHVVLDPAQLASAHRRAGLEAESVEYFLTVNLNAINLGSWRRGLVRRCFERAFTAISRAEWLVDDLVPWLRPNPWSSPNIICVARRPDA
jgi:2-polyprenyl-3-methyl-5-hydroxy-6-metoxy-1,4-benzoquinol methylase